MMARRLWADLTTTEEAMIAYSGWLKSMAAYTGILPVPAYDGHNAITGRWSRNWPRECNAKTGWASSMLNFTGQNPFGRESAIEWLQEYNVTGGKLDGEPFAIVDGWDVLRGRMEVLFEVALKTAFGIDEDGKMPEFGFSDEFGICDSCYQIVYTGCDPHTGYDVWYGDGFMECKRCMLADPEEYVEWYQQNLDYDHATCIVHPGRIDGFVELLVDVRYQDLPSTCKRLQALVDGDGENRQLDILLWPGVYQYDVWVREGPIYDAEGIETYGGYRAFTEEELDAIRADFGQDNDRLGWS